MSVRILRGDVLAMLATLPDESVHCCVTSPPYYGLRDYGVAGQLGLEPTLAEYIEKMVAVFREVRRVLRDDGTLWLNIGDSYANGGRRTRDPGKSKIHPSYEGDAYPDGVRPLDPEGIKPKDLIGVPWALAFALRADGWYLRSEIIWHKRACMPESVTDRPTKSHEQIFLMAKSEYTGAVLPISCSEVDASWLAAIIDGEGSVGIGRTSNGGFQCHIHVSNTCRPLLEKCAAITGVGRVSEGGKGVNWPVYRWQVTGPQAASILYRIRGHLIAKQRQADNALELQESQRRYGGHRKPESMTAYQAMLHAKGKALNKGECVEVAPNRAAWTGGAYYYDAEAASEESVDPEGSAKRYESDFGGAKADGRIDQGLVTTPKGSREFSGRRNWRDVWSLFPEPFKDAHFATFPTEIPRRAIVAGCPVGGTVLDPFLGSGTTALVADRLQRNAIGIELNPAYADMAEKRIRGDFPLFADVA